MALEARVLAEEPLRELIQEPADKPEREAALT
jgi:hypothetical protein